jgi:putative spermidine/putrescine transport system ATP-binding protein
MRSARAPAQAAITVRSASKIYGTEPVLDGVSLDVRPGEFLTLLGPSGSGKTTLLNIIAGFIRPDAGAVLIGGEDMTDVPPHRRGIGIVFQNYALFPHMNVAENVAFALKARKVGREEIKHSVERALSLVKLQGFGARRIDQISGGQRQRVALARAIVFRPKVILMDEPLSALDKQLREHMQIEIATLHEQLDATTIYVTHDQREALTMSHRVAVLNRGRIAQLGTPQDVYDRPATAFVAEFVGEATLMQVTRVDNQTVLFEGQTIQCAASVPQGENLALVIRAEKLRVSSGGAPNEIEATVCKRIFQGESHIVLLELASGRRFAFRQPAHASAEGAVPPDGSRVRLSLHPEHAVVVRVDGALQERAAAAASPFSTYAGGYAGN